MAVYESKRGLLCRHPPVVMMTIIIMAAALMNADCGGAAVIVKSNATNGCISGREEECLIAEDMELELLLMEYSSHVTRVLLAADPDPTTPGSLIRKNVPCLDGEGKPYNCDPNRKTKPNGNCRNAYDRGCKR